MTDRELSTLARRAGVSVAWTDFEGRRRDVAPDSLRVILAALGLPARSRSDIREGLDRLKEQSRSLPTTITAVAGTPVRLSTRSKHCVVTLENGRSRRVGLRRFSETESFLVAPKTTGYHTVEVDGAIQTLATAPRAAFSLPERAGGLWGVTVQLYALRGGPTDGYGDFAALGSFVETIARAGADAVAISPIHSAMPAASSYTPYSPSTRHFFDHHFVAVRQSRPPPSRQHDLIQWPRALERKNRELERAYAIFSRKDRAKSEFRAFIRREGTRLLAHARFEALSARFEGAHSWRDWPEPFRDPQSSAVQSLAPEDPAVERHLFRQWLADRQLAEAQRGAKHSGMGIGLVLDVAVGMDKSGSHAWTEPNEVLAGVSIGAPPDLLSHEGQNWGLTTLSPTALHAKGFAGFIATLRTAMRHAGGIRIDHAMGLQRLWLIPDGANAIDGAYLRYPFDDQLRLIMLESVRNRSIVVAEDLGTVPSGFRGKIAKAGFLGMRILQFEKTREGRFKAPGQWDRLACALSTTHDLPTTAGWWRGRDIGWRKRIWKDFPARKALAQREKDKHLLWAALAQAGCARGRAPASAQEQRVVDQALPYLAKARSELALFPVEDIAGLLEQPNLPGTVQEHPNWRRRLPVGNGISTPRQRRRLRDIAKAREP